MREVIQEIPFKDDKDMYAKGYNDAAKKSNIVIGDLMKEIEHLESDLTMAYQSMQDLEEQYADYDFSDH